MTLVEEEEGGGDLNGDILSPPWYINYHVFMLQQSQNEVTGDYQSRGICFKGLWGG